MNWVINNINWVKDIFWVLFTLVASIVSIKTYMKAKSTILQPLRTEVAKRQTDLLLELLSLFMDKENDFFMKVDYISIVNANILLSMDSYGYLLEDNKMYSKAREHIIGFIILGIKRKINV